ncbi:MAG: PAS domain-containing protein [Rhodobiaceae bacterium]|nr:PAS domain-containing protein [Rhodobiaceae bacterium]
MSDPQLDQDEFSDFRESDDEWTTRVLTSGPFANLLSDWHEARQTDSGNTKLPTTSSLTAEKMSPYLKDISIFDYISHDEIVYRFVGTDIAERMGHDVTGENVLALSEGPGQSHVQKVLRRVSQTPEIVLVSYLNAYSSGRQAGVISLMLPIQGPKNAPPRIVALHRPDTVRSYLGKRAKVQIGKIVDRTIWISI